MAKKPLRAIAEKGDKKLVSDKLKGDNSSKIEPLDLEDLVMSPEGNKATVDFGKKYMKIQKHADRVGNKDVPYVAKNKVSPYPGADAKMYEAADCTCDDDKEDDSCSVHGKKNRKLLLGGKKSMKENVVSVEEAHGVYLKGGSIGTKKENYHPQHGELVKTFDTAEEAKEHAKSRNKMLSPGEKKYYGMRYHVKQIAENVEFSTLDTTPGLVPTGMQAVAKNLWNTADNHLTGPTVATGQGRPFIAKLGDEIKQIQKEAVEIMNGEITEKKWIKGAIKHPGALHRELGVPAGEKIPASKLNAAAKEGGKLGMRARLAKTLGKMHEEHKSMEGEILKPGDQVGYKEGHEKYGHIHSISNDGHAKIKIWNDNTGSHDHVTKHVSRLWKEEYVAEVAPPSKSSEDWIKKNKSRFTKEYGKDKGERVLYGKAWKDYKAKHEENETEYTNAQNGSTKKQLPGGNDKLDTGNL